MPPHQWNRPSFRQYVKDRASLVALAAGLLSVSWLPLSVQAWSAAWSAWHPASEATAASTPGMPATRPAMTFWPTASRWAGCWLESSLGEGPRPYREQPAIARPFR